MEEEQKMTTPEPLEPLHVSIIGGTGDGTVKGTVAVTPKDQPNLVINVVSPLVALVVRFGNFYGTTLLGMLGAAMTPTGARLLSGGGDTMNAIEFGHIFINCASISLAPAAIDLLKNVVTIFKGLEGKYPLLTGSI